MVEISSRARNSFKFQTVLLSYLAASKKTNIYPTMMMIEEQVHHHFIQEFALDARIYERYEVLGASDEEAFLLLLQNGTYNEYSPDQGEIEYILDQLQFTFFDKQGYVHNSVLQEVW